MAPTLETFKVKQLHLLMNKFSPHFAACSLRSVFPRASRPSSRGSDLSILAHPRRGQPPLAGEVPRGRPHRRPRNAQH